MQNLSDARVQRETFESHCRKPDRKGIEPVQCTVLKSGSCKAAASSNVCTARLHGLEDLKRHHEASLGTARSG